MDPIKTIGHKLTGNEQRDAIHIAIMPSIATQNLYPGDEVSLVYGTKDQAKHAYSVYDMTSIGIVDPFLKDYVKKGERFWIFLHPNSVSGMRHHWQHPIVDHCTWDRLT